MYVSLTVVDGPAIGQRLMLRSGQLASVGSTGWSDFCVAGDPSLADRHFELACEMQGCRCRSLDPANTVHLNDQPAQECWLRSGDLLRAGGTVFRVEISGITVSEQQATADRESQIAASPLAPSVAARRTAEQISEKTELSEQAQNPLQDDPLPGPFFDQLIAEQLYEDAVKFLAMWLPRESAIAWAHDCLEELGLAMTAAQAEAFAAVEQWLDDPSEDTRARAAELAKRADYEGAVSWLAAATGWCGGSLSAAGAPPMAPPIELAGQAVIASLMLAATEQGDEHTVERYQAFLKRGKSMCADVFPE